MKKAAIIVSNGVEESEALVTRDLLYRAGIKVDLIGLTKQIISSHELSFNADKTIDEMNEIYDCLILPGGMPGTINLEKDERVINQIKIHLKENKYLAAICAAPSILLHLNLLKDNEFTCFKGFEENLKRRDEKAVISGKIITGSGLGAVNEFSYLIISELISKEKAQEVLDRIGY